MAGSTIRPAAPAFLASAAKRQARAVVHSATPVSTGTRLPTAATTALSTSSFSGYSREQFSPTVPSTIMP